ncbi:hypothetical protein CASFOL_017339 [Castilleja foliolosa]|uniref:Replication factor A C-terminal domain-containing protein n=1 Tax=Castilleja foliolosa TaxID=1961234 RepID=A0ABD3DBR2_9LAMI
MDQLFQPMHKVDSLFTVTEESTFWICAIIADIIGDWWYVACLTCNGSMVETGSKYHCHSCRRTYDSGLYRYKMQVIVLDSSATASLLCFDRDTEILTGIPCHDLYRYFIETREYAGDLPDELGSLIDQTVLFRVRVKENQVHKESSVFTVIGLETDPTLVANYNMFTRER